jgi:hypothetical protein
LYYFIGHQTFLTRDPFSILLELGDENNTSDGDASQRGRGRHGRSSRMGLKPSDDQITDEIDKAGFEKKD